MNNNQASNDQSKENSRLVMPLPPSSMQKKDKNKDKKKKNKEKKEKPNVKKYHKRNKADSYSDNDDGDWLKSTPRHNSSTGSERSVRRNKEQLHQQVSSNPLDVWVVSGPFFKPLPTASEIEKVCGDLEKEIDQTSEKNDNEKHWSLWMKDAVINTINASHGNSSKSQKSTQQSSNDQSSSRNDSNSLKDSNISNYFINSYGLKKKEYPRPLPSNHAEILFPPEPSPDLSDISSFWCENVQEFPVTDLQIQNYSIVDNILSAFVVAEPDKNHDNFFQNMIIEYDSPFSLQKTTEKSELSIIDNNDTISNKNSKVEEESEKIFLPTNVPVPHIEFDDYLSHSFEDRLEMELQSAGFTRPDERHVTINNSLAHEFEKYNKELEKLQPQIDAIKEEVLSNLDTYKKEEERRIRELRNYNELIPKKTHKK